MAYASDSTRTPSTGGPVTRALAAMRVEPEPVERCLVLRALAALPIISGAAALVTSSRAAAEPVTRELLVTYADWLLMERRRLLREIFTDPSHVAAAQQSCIGHSTAADLFHIPFDGQGGPSEPSTRAALVLSAVGCEWRV